MNSFGSVIRNNNDELVEFKEKIYDFRYPILFSTIGGCHED